MEEYDYISTLGEGAYGHVWKCQDRSTGRIVAIKGFKHAHEEPEIMKLAEREVRVLQSLDHPAIIRLIEAFKSKSGRVYMVFPFIGRSAYQELDYRPEGLPATQLKLLVWQLLQALLYLHNRKIVHRDIKPANILLSEAGGAKLCDFGFARPTRCGPRDAQQLSTYVVTRWYRAPEVILGDVYGPASDIWSLGCTVAELACGQPLFPGKSSADQLWRIIRCFGPLAPKDRARVESDPRFAEAANGGRGRTLRERIPDCEPGLLCFLEACLQMDPSRRPVASELLQMPYFWSVPKLLAGSALKDVYYDVLQQASNSEDAAGMQQKRQQMHRRQQQQRQQQHQQAAKQAQQQFPEPESVARQSSPQKSQSRWTPREEHGAAVGASGLRGLVMADAVASAVTAASVRPTPTGIHGGGAVTVLPPRMPPTPHMSIPEQRLPALPGPALCGSQPSDSGSDMSLTHMSPDDITSPCASDQADDGDDDEGTSHDSDDLTARLPASHYTAATPPDSSGGAAITGMDLARVIVAAELQRRVEGRETAEASALPNQQHQERPAGPFNRVPAPAAPVPGASAQAFTSQRAAADMRTASVQPQVGAPGPEPAASLPPTFFIPQTSGPVGSTAACLLAGSATTGSPADRPGPPIQASPILMARFAGSLQQDQETDQEAEVLPAEAAATATVVGGATASSSAMPCSSRLLFPKPPILAAPAQSQARMFLPDSSLQSPSEHQVRAGPVASTAPGGRAPGEPSTRPLALTLAMPAAAGATAPEGWSGAAMGRRDHSQNQDQDTQLPNVPYEAIFALVAAAPAAPTMPVGSAPGAPRPPAALATAAAADGPEVWTSPFRAWPVAASAAASATAARASLVSGPSQWAPEPSGTSFVIANDPTASHLLTSFGGYSTLGPNSVHSGHLALCDTVMFEDCAGAPFGKVAQLRAGPPAPKPRGAPDGDTYFCSNMMLSSMSQPASWAAAGAVTGGDSCGGLPICSTPPGAPPVRPGQKQAPGPQASPSDHLSGQQHWTRRAAAFAASLGRGQSRASMDPVASNLPALTTGARHEVEPGAMAAAGKASTLSASGGTASAAAGAARSHAHHTNSFGFGGASGIKALITGRRSQQYPRPSATAVADSPAAGPVSYNFSMSLSRSTRLAQAVAHMESAPASQQPQAVPSQAQVAGAPATAVRPVSLGSCGPWVRDGQLPPSPRMRSLAETGHARDEEDVDDAAVTDWDVVDFVAPSVAAAGVAGGAATGGRGNGRGAVAAAKAWEDGGGSTGGTIAGGGSTGATIAGAHTPLLSYGGPRGSSTASGGAGGEEWGLNGGDTAAQPGAGRVGGLLGGSNSKVAPAPAPSNLSRSLSRSRSRSRFCSSRNLTANGSAEGGGGSSAGGEGASADVAAQRPGPWAVASVSLCGAPDGLSSAAAAEVRDSRDDVPPLGHAALASRNPVREKPRAASEGLDGGRGAEAAAGGAAGSAEAQPKRGEKKGALARLFGAVKRTLKVEVP